MQKDANLSPLESPWDWASDDLRFYRMRAGLSLSEMGKIMGVNRQGVSNMEHGRIKMQEHHAKALDAHFDLNRHFERLVAYGRRAHKPDWQREYVRYERQALSIWTMQHSWIAGLLQTEDYARAVFALTPAADIESRVQARMRRQAVLDLPNAPDLWVIQDEAAVGRPIGGADVMCAQLQHLLDMGERPNISVRVVPMALGAYEGLDGASAVMELPKGSVGYFEAPNGGRLVESRHEVRSMLVRHHRVAAEALPESASRELIKEKMRGLAEKFS